VGVRLPPHSRASVQPPQVKEVCMLSGHGALTLKDMIAAAGDLVRYAARVALAGRSGSHNGFLALAKKQRDARDEPNQRQLSHGRTANSRTAAGTAQCVMTGNRE